MGNEEADLSRCISEKLKRQQTRIRSGWEDVKNIQREFFDAFESKSDSKIFESDSHLRTSKTFS